MLAMLLTIIRYQVGLMSEEAFRPLQLTPLGLAE